MGGSDHRNRTVLARKLLDYLRWGNTHARHPDVLAAQRRERARVRSERRLGWHQLKQVQGLLIAAVPFGVPGLAPRLVAMPADELAQVLTALDVPADEADRLKRRGLYVDVGRGGRIREPSEITETEVLSQLARAGQAVSAAGRLLEPETQARLTSAVAEGVELSRASVSALTGARYARSPEDAADVVLNAVCKLREHMPQKDAPQRATTS